MSANSLEDGGIGEDLEEICVSLRLGAHPPGLVLEVGAHVAEVDQALNTRLSGEPARGNTEMR